MANIKISGNDILREGEKIGHITGNDVYNDRGEKVGYFSGDDIYDEGGRKTAYIEGNKLMSSVGRSENISRIEREVRGGNLSNLERAAVKVLFNRSKK